MIPVQLIVAGVIAVASFGAGWTAQGWRADASMANLRNDYSKRDFRALENAHADTLRLQATKDEAERKHAIRVADLRKSVAATAVIADGLRNDLATARAAMPDASCSSLRGYSATLSTVFDECAAEVGRVASQADGHAIDALKLLEAWPTSAKP